MKINKDLSILMDSYSICLECNTKDKEENKYWSVVSAFVSDGRPLAQFRTDSLSDVFALLCISKPKDLQYVEDTYRNKFQLGEIIRLKKDRSIKEYTINGYLSFEDFVASIQELEKSL